jgi:tetratricopeptide (TPR) repeat protein/energy-coupling factor transporter ATP-binding protein EcfA2
MAPMAATIFLSGTLRDLPEHREAAIEACRRLGLIPVMIDHLPADDVKAVERCRVEVESADVYLGVFAYRYGYVPSGGSISLPELEYDVARQSGKTCLVFLMNEDHPVRKSDVDTGTAGERLEAFKRRLQSEPVTGYFRSADDLRAGVIGALSEYLMRSQSPILRSGSDIPEPPEPYVVHPYVMGFGPTLIGREYELGLLDEWVSKTGSDVNKAPVFGFTGLGGTGKTALAWNWFHEHAPQRMRPLAGRFWWSFYEDGDFDRWTSAALAYVGRMPINVASGLDRGDREAKLLAALDREPFLFVLDGAERLLALYASPEATHRRRPASADVAFFLRRLVHLKASRVLLTSRVRPADFESPAGQTAAGCVFVEVSGLDDDSALAYWNTLGGTGERADLLATFRGFGNHPLAIGVLAAAVANYRPAPGDFHQWRRDNPAWEVYRASPDTQGTEIRLADSILYAANPRALRVLRAVACFRQSVPFALLYDVFVTWDGGPIDSKYDLGHLLSDLEDRGLVRWKRDTNRYDVHPFLRSQVLPIVDDTERRSLTTALEAASAAIEAKSENDQLTLDDALPDIGRFHLFVDQSDHDAAYDHYRHRLKRILVDRIFHLRTEVELLERLFPAGPDSVERLTPSFRISALNDLGYAHFRTGRPGLAAECFRRVRREPRIESNNEAEWFTATIGFAEASMRMGRLRESESAARAALVQSRSRKNVGWERQALLPLGEILLERGELALARASLLRAVALHELADGPGAASAYSRLAQVMYSEGESNAALSTARTSASIAETQGNDLELLRAKRVIAQMAREPTESATASKELRLVEARAREVGLVEEELFASVELARLSTAARTGEDRVQTRLHGVIRRAMEGPYRLILGFAQFSAVSDAENRIGVLRPAERDRAIAGALDAYRSAWCDGPPFADHWTLGAAGDLLRSLNVSEPTDLRAYNDYDYEPMPVVEIEQSSPRIGVRGGDAPRDFAAPAGELNTDLTEPVYLRSIEIQNVRCFGPPQRLDLCNKTGKPAAWTVILGNNGVGKTTVLQCIAALGADLDPFFLGQQRLLVPHGDTDSVLARSGTPPEVAATVEIGARLRSSDAGRVESATILRASLASGRPPSIERLREVPHLVCYGYGASRRMEETSLRERGPDLPVMSLFSDDSALRNAEEWLVQADYAASKESPIRDQATRRFGEIRQLLTGLLPDVDDLRIPSPEDGRSRPYVEAHTPYGWVPLRVLSVGYKTMIAWMVDLAWRMYDRYPNSLRPVSEPAIVLIDEVDLHLHPRWQRTLMGYLSRWFENTQFIVTAHSPLVVQAAADANLVLLRRVGEHVEIDNDVRAIRGWRVDQILTSDLFDLPSARPAELDDAIKERTEILAKSEIGKMDRARLRELNRTIGNLPSGETSEDIEAMSIIRRAAKILKQKGGNGA